MYYNIILTSYMSLLNNLSDIKYYYLTLSLNSKSFNQFTVYSYTSFTVTSKFLTEFNCLYPAPLTLHINFVINSYYILFRYTRRLCSAFDSIHTPSQLTL